MSDREGLIGRNPSQEQVIHGDVNYGFGHVEVLLAIRHGAALLNNFTTYNRKSVTVVTDDGHRWNVSPSLLFRTALPDTAGPQPNQA